MFPDLRKFHYKRDEFVIYLKNLAFTREWVALFKDLGKGPMYKDYHKKCLFYYNTLKDIIK